MSSARRLTTRLRLALPAVTLPALALLGACITPPYTGSAVPFGTVDLGQEEKLNAKIKSTDASKAAAVRVVRGKLPDGLQLADNGRKLVVDASHAEVYEVLGQAISRHKYDLLVARFRAVYWYVDAADGQRGRDIYCKTQTPFRVLTLGLWLLTPFQWPCFADYPEGNVNLERHLQQLRRVATAMGGNLLILAERQDTSVLTIYAHQSYPMVFADEREGSAYIAFVVRQLRQAPAPARLPLGPTAALHEVSRHLR